MQTASPGVNNHALLPREDGGHLKGRSPRSILSCISFGNAGGPNTVLADLIKPPPWSGTRCNGPHCRMVMARRVAAAARRFARDQMSLRSLRVGCGISTEYEAFCRTASRMVGARTALAVAYARTSQVDNALEHLEAALALEPGAFEPRCGLGELYLRLGIPEQARPHLQRALEVARTATERSYVQALLKEDRARARRRAPRPSFRTPFWLLRRQRKER